MNTAPPTSRPAPPKPMARPVPRNLPPQRAWRWCLLTTLRDWRHSHRAGRPISAPNLRRLLDRRWAQAAPRSPSR